MDVDFQLTIVRTLAAALLLFAHKKSIRVSQKMLQMELLAETTYVADHLVYALEILPQEPVLASNHHH